MYLDMSYYWDAERSKKYNMYPLSWKKLHAVVIRSISQLNCKQI